MKGPPNIGGQFFWQAPYIHDAGNWECECECEGQQKKQRWQILQSFLGRHQQRVQHLTVLNLVPLGMIAGVL
jgi:hypothetical protein